MISAYHGSHAFRAVPASDELLVIWLSITNSTTLKHRKKLLRSPRIAELVYALRRFLCLSDSLGGSTDFSGLMGNHFCTLCRNFVRFRSVTPEFKFYYNA